MSDSEKALDYLEQQIPSLSAAAVDVAYWQALAAGQQVLVSGEGGPNGSGKSTIKSVVPPELLGVYRNPDDG